VPRKPLENVREIVFRINSSTTTTRQDRIYDSFGYNPVIGANIPCVEITEKKEKSDMRTRRGKGIVAGVALLAWFVLCLPAPAADAIVGQWNYTTSNHWSKGPVPAGKPSKGVLVIKQEGDQFKMEFKSGMVFSPSELKYFTGKKNDPEYVFSNSARVDNEGGVAKNTCTLKMAADKSYKGKSFSQYSNSGITFSWGFEIELTR